MKKLFIGILCFLLSLGCMLYGFAVSNIQQPTESIMVYISAPDNISVYNISSTALSVKWSSVSGADGYTVILRDKNTGETVKTKKTENNYIKFSSLSPATLYSATVISLMEGYSSQESAAASALTMPGVVKTVKTAEASKSSITLYWSKSEGADGYEIFQFDKEKNAFVLIAETTQKTYTVKKLEKGRIYNFRIRSFMLSGKEKLRSDFSPIHTEITAAGQYPTTREQAASLYNKVINAAKSQENIRIVHTKTLSTEATDCSHSSIFRTVKNLASLYNGKIKNTYNITAGGKNKAANDVLYPLGKEASVKGKNIASYSFKKLSDGTFRLTVTFKSDVIDSAKKGSLSNNAQVITPTSVKSIRVKPLKIDSHILTYEGATVKIRLSPEGEAQKIVIENPVILDAQCHVSSINFSARVRYSVKESFILTY